MNIFSVSSGPAELGSVSSGVINGLGFEMRLRSTEGYCITVNLINGVVAMTAEDQQIPLAMVTSSAFIGAHNRGATLSKGRLEAIESHAMRKLQATIEDRLSAPELIARASVITAAPKASEYSWIGNAVFDSKTDRRGELGIDMVRKKVVVAFYGEDVVYEVGPASPTETFLAMQMRTWPYENEGQAIEDMIRSRYVITGYDLVDYAIFEADDPTKAWPVEKILGTSIF